MCLAPGTQLAPAGGHAFPTSHPPTLTPPALPGGSHGISSHPLWAHAQGPRTADGGHRVPAHCSPRPQLPPGSHRGSRGQVRSLPVAPWASGVTAAPRHVLRARPPSCALTESPHPCRWSEGGLGSGTGLCGSRGLAPRPPIPSCLLRGPPGTFLGAGPCRRGSWYPQLPEGQLSRKQRARGSAGTRVTHLDGTCPRPA